MVIWKSETLRSSRDQATATRILRLVTLVLCTGPSCRRGTTSVGGCTGIRSESVCFATLVCALRSQSCYSTPRPIQLNRDRDGTAVRGAGAGTVEGPAVRGAGAETVEGPGSSENTSNRLFFRSAIIVTALAA